MKFAATVLVLTLSTGCVLAADETTAAAVWAAFVEAPYTHPNGRPLTRGPQ